MTKDKILISKKAAAERLSVSLRTVDYLVSRGELKARRVGKRVLFRPEDLEVFARRDHPSPSKQGQRPRFS